MGWSSAVAAPVVLPQLYYCVDAPALYQPHSLVLLVFQKPRLDTWNQQLISDLEEEELYELARPWRKGAVA
jgi:hypothetical protein